MKNELLMLAFSMVLGLWLAGCDVGTKTDDPLKMKAPTKLWQSVVPGVPFGSTYRLGGWYKVRYVDADPYDELKSNVIIYCTYGAIIAGIAIIGSFVMLYYGIPFWKDVLAIAGISFIGCFALALIVQYMIWIIIGCAIAVACYIGYVWWRETQHAKTQEELVTTGSLLKRFTNWGNDEKLAVLTAQSDSTIEQVKATEKKAKDKADRILRKIPSLAALAPPLPAPQEAGA